ncbi:MAG: hypothetical protein HUJ27_01505 [Rhodobacteraceae bacterium]|nr:hypothetical protein [Paracoccaceae bacterium]
MAALFFAIRLTVFTIYWSDPDHRDQPIAGWMTLRYVVHSWDVPPEVVAGALSLEMDGTGRRVTLEELGARRGVSVQELARDLDRAIREYRESGNE